MTVIPETEELAARLRDRRNAAWAGYRALADIAAIENRPLTRAEQDRSDDLAEEMSRLDKRLRSVLDTDTFFDAGNTLLSQVTCQLHTGTIREEGEEPRGVVTVRTASTTVSVVLGAGDLAVWLDILSGLHESLAVKTPPAGKPVIPDKKTGTRPEIIGLEEASGHLLR